MIRLLVADDHAIVRTGIRALLARERDFAIVGEAGDVPSARELLDREPVDVVLLDLTMPGDGLSLVGFIVEHHPRVRALVLSMHADADRVRWARAAGAHGYIVKGAGLDELVRALRMVAAGGTWFPSEPATAAREASNDTTLSPRESEVVRLVALGRTNRDIAKVLGISPKTVDAHRTNVMRKLQVHDAQALTRWAVRQGLIEPI